MAFSGFCDRRALARHARAIRQLELSLCALHTLEQDRRVGRGIRNPGELGPPGDKEHAIDSTIVRAHQHAAGVKGGIKIGKRSVARAAASRRKSTSARTPKATR